MATCSSNQTNMWLYGRELIKLGYSIKTVQIEAGMTYKQIQKLTSILEHEGVIGKKTKKTFKKSAAKLLSDHYMKWQASILMQIYAFIAGPEHRINIDIDSLNKAYQMYISIYAELPDDVKHCSEQISINDGWILANELRSGEAFMEMCGNCKAAYYSSENQNTTIDCPFCYKGRVRRAKMKAGNIPKLANAS